jgi:signal transduction histidine kinase
MMTPTVFTGDATQFFAASGWRQFFLDEQFALSPPCSSLAELCNIPSSRLTGYPFLNLFSSSTRETLHSCLLQLTATSTHPISSLTLELQSDNHNYEPVEVMLYPAPEKNSRHCYVGFIRSVPDTTLNFLAENIKPQLGLKNKQFETVAQLGHHIASILDSGTLLDYVVESLSRNSEYQYTSIFLVDNDETCLTLRAASNISIDNLPPDCLNLNINRQTIIGHVATTAKPIRLGNITGHGYDISGHLPIKTQSELAIPVVSGGQVLGVLDVQSDVPDKYGNDDLFLLQVIANQLAVAIQNARLFEERDRRMAELAVFNQIGVAIIGDQDLQSMLSDILRRVSALFQVEAVSLMLLEEDGLHFAVAVGAGADEIKSFVLKPGQGIAWSVVDTRKTIRVDNVKTDPRHFSDIDSAISFSTKSLIAVPVQIQDRILGVIEVMNRLDSHPFSRDDEAALEFIASAVAVVIENTRLFQETQAQLKALTTLTQSSEAITKAPNLEQLLNIVLNFALSIIGAESGAIVLADPMLIHSLKIEVARGIEQEKIELFNRSNISQHVGIFGETYRTRQIIEVEDSHTDSRVFTSSETAWIFSQSFTNIPLFSHDDFIGIVILHALPDGDTRALLKAVADMAAVAIEKTRLFKETNRWLADVLTLYTLADQLTKVLDLTHIVEVSVSVLKHAMDCNGCCIFLKEKTGKAESLVLKGCSGRNESDQKNAQMAYIIKLTEGLMANPQQVYIENVTNLSLDSDSQKTDQKEAQMGSVMIVPLIVKDELIGALSIDHRHPNAFGHAEERLLAIATAQISTAIENIKLYDDLEQRAVELEIALEEVQEANRLKSEFVQNVSHELRTPLTYVTAYVELILEGSLGEVSQEIKEKLKIVSQKSQAITRLVEDVTSLQKIEASNLTLELITTHELITRAADEAIARAAEYNIEIVPNDSPDLPMVQVDTGRIGQVFDNLVANALKFSPAGSKINISAEREGDFIKFSVQDYGIGIPSDKLDKVFERFYQVDGSTTRRYKGAGLGLAIVKQIVEAHSGQITVESVVNKSTTFSFLLPIYKSERNSEST